jgi:hypothetical protein
LTVLTGTTSIMDGIAGSASIEMFHYPSGFIAPSLGA